jgi:hypothetical protein
MAFIPRQAKPPARVPINCKVPEEIASLLKQYAAFLESSQEHIVSETLRVAFRRDKEFQAWLATRRAEATLEPHNILITEAAHATQSPKGPVRVHTSAAADRRIPKDEL